MLGLLLAVFAVVAAEPIIGEPDGAVLVMGCFEVPMMVGSSRGDMGCTVLPTAGLGWMNNDCCFCPFLDRLLLTPEMTGSSL